MNLEVRKRKCEDVGSCNECAKGKLNEDGKGLTYPYEYVYELVGDHGIYLRFCSSCLDSFRKIIKALPEND